MLFIILFIDCSNDKNFICQSRLATVAKERLENEVLSQSSFMLTLPIIFMNSKDAKNFATFMMNSAMNKQQKCEIDHILLHTSLKKKQQQKLSVGF